MARKTPSPVTAPPAPQEPLALIWRIVEVTCRYRDHDWDEDAGDLLDEVDAAVDAWREHLRKVRNQ